MKIASVFFITLLLLGTGACALSSPANSVSPASGTQYSQGAIYVFNIYWDPGDLSVENVIFESNLSTLSDSLSNITALNFSSFPNTFFANFTDLPAGSYVYRWYAVDNESNWNFTDQFVFTISKNSSAKVRLSLNGTESNRSYVMNTAVNLTASLNVSGGTVYLSSTYPVFVTQSGTSTAQATINLTSQGLFSATAYWDGDQNYTGSSETFYFDNAPPQFSEVSENPSEAATYALGRTYAFNIRWADANITQVTFDSNLSGSSRTYTASTSPAIQNNSNFFFIAFTDLPAENFVYKWTAVDNVGQTANTSMISYRIFKAAPLLLEVVPAKSVIQGTQTSVRCLSTTAEVSIGGFTLSRDSTSISNDTLYSRKDEQFLAPGSYFYLCSSTATQNFTNQSINATVMINQTSSAPSLDISGPSSMIASPGSSMSQSFYLNNNLGYTLSGLFVRLDDIDPSWYTIADLPLSIPNNFSMQIRVNFNIPQGANEGNYPLSVRAVAKSPSNATQSTTKNLSLAISVPQEQSLPPVYSPDTANSTVINGIYEFMLQWTDDRGLSGYIFSSNITGEWENSSWTPMYGANSLSYYSENVTLAPGAIVDWKFYVNDSSDLWSDSQEFSLTAAPKGSGFDLLPLVILMVFVAALAALLFFIAEKKGKAKSPKKNVEYVYNQEDLKK